MDLPVCDFNLTSQKAFVGQAMLLLVPYLLVKQTNHSAYDQESLFFRITLPQCGWVAAHVYGDQVGHPPRVRTRKIGRTLLRFLLPLFYPGFPLRTFVL